MHLAHTLHEFLALAVEFGIIFFEAVGIIILMLAGIRGFYCYICRKNLRHLHLELAHGMSIALGFMLGGEILRTVTSSGWQTSVNIGLLILLRASMTLLLHWEAKSEEKEIEEEEEKEKERHKNNG